MVAIRKNLVLIWQVGTTGIDQINTRQPILRGDLLRAKMLFHRDGIIRAAFDRGVVTDDHALVPRDTADTSDDSGRRNLVTIHAKRGELADFKKWRTRIQQRLNAVARQQFTP